jgi:hypothetical protein
MMRDVIVVAVMDVNIIGGPLPQVQNAFPPSSSKRTQFILPQDQLTALNDKMNKAKDDQAWPLRSGNARDDNTLLPLLSHVLVHFTSYMGHRYEKKCYRDAEPRPRRQNCDL